MNNVKWRLVYLGERDSYECASYTEAFGEARAADLIPNSLYIFHYKEPTVHYGRGAGRGKVKHNFCVEHGIKIVRSNNLSPNPFFCDKSMPVICIVYRSPEECTEGGEMLRCQKGIVNTLAALGLKTEIKRGGNDVLKDGKRIAGGVVSSYKGIWETKFTLLNAPDFSVVVKTMVCKHDPWKSDTTLKVELGSEPSPSDIVKAFKEGFQPVYNAQFGDVEYDLTEIEKSIVVGLREKYTSNEWIRLGKWSPVKDYWRPE